MLSILLAHLQLVIPKAAICVHLICLKTMQALPLFFALFFTSKLNLEVFDFLDAFPLTKSDPT